MKVLIAEDNAVSRFVLKGHLERWGHEVTEAATGDEAWQQFDAGNYQLVITDWMMPVVDGPELIRRIRGCRRPGYVYIILLSARSQKTDVVSGMEAGADDFVTKPFDRDELRVRLHAGERIIHLEQTLADQNQALRDAQAALVENEKLASLGRLAAGVAHEINNPLAYVTNNLAVLRRDMQAALGVLDAYRAGHGELAAQLALQADLDYFRANFARMCDKALEGVGRVRDIVKNLRDFARLDEAEFKEADLNAAVESSIEVLDHEFKAKGIHLKTEFQPVPPVLCHAGKLNQVILNLLVNAIQACDHGGTVGAGTRVGEDGSVVLEITDNGAGIRPEHMPRIFEPFFTTKAVGQGTGLGLSVSFGIIRDHGGKIEVDSQVGRGSAFRVRLPLPPPTLNELRSHRELSRTEGHA
jgi:signal transduction histidine kinase